MCVDDDNRRDQDLIAIPSLISTITVACINPSSNFCPILCQTCLACFLACGQLNELPGGKIELRYALQSPRPLDLSAINLLTQLYSVLSLKSLPLDSIIGDVLRNAPPEVMHLPIAHTPTLSYS